MVLREYKEAHQKGIVSLENVPGGLMQEGYIIGDFGIQIAKDGRVWVCINGLAFLRFNPHPDGKISKEALPKGEPARERWIRMRREHGKADNPELYDRGDVEP